MLDLFDDLEMADDRIQAVRVIDLEREVATRNNVASFTRAMWIAVAMLLLFNSAGLVDVVNGFGVGPVQDAAVAMATTWNDQMEKNGLPKIVAAVRSEVEHARNATWGEFTAHAQSGAAMLRGSLGEGPGKG